MHLCLGLLLIEGKARSLLVSTDAHNVTNERKRGSLCRIPMNKPASVEPSQLEAHPLGYCRGRACISPLTMIPSPSIGHTQTESV